MENTISRKKLGIIIIIFLSLLCIQQLSLIIFNNTGLRDIAVTTNATKYDEFDTWLTQDIGIKAVPCHLFIKNGEVVNSVEYYITPHTFKKYYKTKKYHKLIWTDDLVDINGNKINLKNYDVIYVAKANCTICDRQNKEEEKIRNKYKNLNFLTYYIKTDKADIDCSQGCE